MPAQIVEAAAAEAERRVLPADPRLVATELERSLELYGVPENWDAVAEFYVEAFDDAPFDLVRLACYRLRRSALRFFPRPGEIRALIADELGARKSEAAKLRAARALRRDPTAPPPPPSEAEKRRVDALVAAALAHLAGGPSGGLSGGTRYWREAAGESAPVTAADRRRIADETARYRLADPESPGVADWLRRMGETP